MAGPSLSSYGTVNFKKHDGESESSKEKHPPPHGDQSIPNRGVQEAKRFPEKYELRTPRRQTSKIVGIYNDIKAQDKVLKNKKMHIMTFFNKEIQYIELYKLHETNWE